MLHLRAFFVANLVIMCFLGRILSEILAEILRKKLASGASALRNPSILLFALWQQVQQESKPVEAQKEMPTASEARTFAGHSCGWDFAGQGGEGGGG